MPVSILAVVLAVLLVGGGVLAAFFWTKSIPSTVKIVGGEVEAFQDEECTIPLTALDYGELRAGETTDTVTFWLKNIGDDPLYAAIAQDELDSLLILYQGAGNVVPADPSRLKLQTGTDYVAGYWQAGTPSTTILTGINASATTVEVASITSFTSTGKLYCQGEVIAYTGLRAYQPEGSGSWQPTATTTTLQYDINTTAITVSASNTAFPASGTIKIEDELISYPSKVDGQFSNCVRGFASTIAAAHTSGKTITLMTWAAGSPEVKAAFTGCTRGAEGTVAASHSASVAISKAEWIGETGGALYNLAAGAKLAVSTYLTADPTITRSDKPFTVIVEAKDTPY
jgi:hypothetical protein